MRSILTLATLATAALLLACAAADAAPLANGAPCPIPGFAAKGWVVALDGRACFAPSFPKGNQPAAVPTVAFLKGK